MEINTGADFETACGRIEELLGCIGHSPEERELEALVDAIYAWQNVDGVELQRAARAGWALTSV